MMSRIEKWIGEEDNSSGSYYEIGTKELQIRKGGYINAKKLYRFESRFGETYYITDEKVINQIEKILQDEDKEETSVKLVDYLYNLIIQKFGVIEFIIRIGHEIAEQRDIGYRRGKLAKQEEIRKVLGL